LAGLLQARRKRALVRPSLLARGDQRGVGRRRLGAQCAIRRAHGVRQRVKARLDRAGARGQLRSQAADGLSHVVARALREGRQQRAYRLHQPCLRGGFPADTTQLRPISGLPSLCDGQGRGFALMLRGLPQQHARHLRLCS